MNKVSFELYLSQLFLKPVFDIIWGRGRGEEFALLENLFDKTKITFGWKGDEQNKTKIIIQSLGVEIKVFRSAGYLYQNSKISFFYATRFLGWKFLP